MNSQDKSTPKIGIVIPIYNVAKYLRECLDSVLNQTYGNFCAVLVNDGSTDFLEGESTSQSLQIAMEYVAKDSRFVLIDKKNGGLSSARNAGIAWFSGECYFGNSPLELHSADSAESSLRGRIVDSHEAIQKNQSARSANPCHTRHTEATKSPKYPLKSFCYFLLSQKVESPPPTIKP